MDKILKTISELGENNTEFLETLKAIKGTAYTAHVAAIANVINIIRTTNSMICEKYPDAIVEHIQQIQSTYTSALVEPFFRVTIPGDDSQSANTRWNACDEMMRNIAVLVERQMAAEKAVGKNIVPRGTDGNGV